METMQLNILVVEDNEGDYFLIHEYLQEAFPMAKLQQAQTLAQAAQALQVNIFDIILLDLTLPDSNGKWSIIQMLNLCSATPVIVLTGFDNKQFGIDALKIGVQDYLVKDEINISILQKCINYSIERKKNQLRLEQNEKRFRALIDNSADGLILLDAKGSLVELSASAQKIIGFGMEEIGKDLLHLVYKYDLPKVNKLFLQTLDIENAIVNAEFRCATKQGAYKWLAATFHNLLHKPSVKAVVVNFRDITSRKVEEEELKLLLEELKKSNADLKQFTYIASHNLRAPVTNLLSVLNLLDWSSITHQTNLQLLQAFKTSTLQLDEILNDLFSILLIKKNKNIHLEQINFQDILQQVIKDANGKMEKAKAEIICNFENAPAVLFDSHYLKSVFKNLLSNSLQFAAAERPLQIKIETAIEENQIKLLFSDNGLGFPFNKKEPERVFGMYQRYHQEQSGKGVGLYLVYSQMNALGGSILAESIEKNGTTFTLYFKNKAND